MSHSLNLLDYEVGGTSTMSFSCYLLKSSRASSLTCNEKLDASSSALDG